MKKLPDIPCSIPGCDNPVVARFSGKYRLYLCKRHYNRERYGRKKSGRRNAVEEFF